MQATRPVIDTVFRKLGGRRVLGQTVTSEADLARLVRRRIPLRTLVYVSASVFYQSKRSGDLSSRSGRSGIARPRDNH